MFMYAFSLTLFSLRTCARQVLASVQQQHTDEMSQLKAQFEKDKADSLSTMRSSITAEKQVLFNEALKKVCTFISSTLNKTL